MEGEKREREGGERKGKGGEKREREGGERKGKGGEDEGESMWRKW